MWGPEIMREHWKQLFCDQFIIYVLDFISLNYKIAIK